MTELPQADRFAPSYVLGKDGPIASTFDAYEPRPPQIQMADAVRANMKSKRHLFCEAGTGTGKSYAALIPAIEAALRGEGPVVISTNTIALQEQIFNKDIPDLKRFLKVPHLKVVLRKGRGNYLSRRRHQGAQNYSWNTDQIRELEDIDNWVDRTSTGTLQELDFIPSREMWEQVRSDQYDCLGQKCPKFSSCFYFKSKEEAEKAHIIVTNHALLALDLSIKLKTDGTVSLMPQYKHLIIDEAHSFEDALRRAGTFEWKEGSAFALAKRATNKKGNGFLDRLIAADRVSHKATTHAKQVVKKLEHFVEVNRAFFDRDIVPFLEGKPRKEIRSATAKRVKPDNLVSVTSSSLIDSAENITKYLNAIVSDLKQWSDETTPKDVKQLALLIEKYAERFRETHSELKRAIAAGKDSTDKYPSHVTSVEAGKFNGKIRYMLVSTPIFVRQIGKEILFDRIPSITLTSATLAIGKSFKNIVRNLGADPKKTDTLLLDHVFDYESQVKLYLLPNLPLDPWNKAAAREKYYDTVADKIKKYVKMTEGNAFILCTSNTQMYALYKRCRPVFEKLGYFVLCQNKGLTREQMIEEFKTVDNSVLFGVDSFWTGVDVPGKSLQNVIITKLPFPPPTPLSEAQQEMYDTWNKGKPKNKQRNFFGDRTVPDVAIKLQQGFGRLVRRKTDTGIVVVMDPRMVTKFYGKTLLKSLPECKVIQDKN